MDMPIVQGEGVFQSVLASRVAMAIVWLAVVAVLTLGLLYSGIPVFGPINDLTNAGMGILIAVLVFLFHPLLRERSPIAAFLFLLAAWIGVILIAGNSVLVAFGRMGWKTGGMYTAIGYGLVGIWMLGVVWLVGSGQVLGSREVILALITGAALQFGYLAGPLLAERLALSNSIVVWTAYLATGAGWLLLPVWAWLLSKRLLV